MDTVRQWAKGATAPPPKTASRSDILGNLSSSQSMGSRSWRGAARGIAADFTIHQHISPKRPKRNRSSTKTWVSSEVLLGLYWGGGDLLVQLITFFDLFAVQKCVKNDSLRVGMILQLHTTRQSSSQLQEAESCSSNIFKKISSAFICLYQLFAFRIIPP